MSLFDKIFGRAPKPKGEYEGEFRVLNGYTPHFTSWGGRIYESDRVRAAIHARATHISKLDVKVIGTAKPALKTKLEQGPNTFSTWSQFLYRVSTILDVTNNCFIVPVYDRYGEVSGIYPVLPERCSFVQYNGTPYLRYQFAWGEHAAIELENCGILNKFQFRNDFLGENNYALTPTMELIHMENQGIKEGVKSAASIRFIAQLDNFSRAEDLRKERTRFSQENLQADSESTGILLFPNYYKNIQQVNSKPFVVDAEQMRLINDSVNAYFGVNEDILTNHYSPEVWSAFYEAVVEPFALQFCDVCSKMLYTYRERTLGSKIVATSNRLQYMSNADKLNVSASMLDRGIMSLNDVRQIWNLPPVEGGDVRIIRGEYYNADNKVQEETEEVNDDAN